MEKLKYDELLMIFEHLSAKDLKNVAEVCQNWNSIISSTSKLLRRLDQIEIFSNDPTLIQNALEEFQKLPHRNLEVHNLTDAMLLNLKTLMEAYGSNIETLVLAQFEIGALLGLLALTPNVSRLTLALLFASETESSHHSKLNLLQLKTLEIWNATESINHIECQEIEKIAFLKIPFWDDYSNGEFNFLSVNGNVKELKISGFDNYKLTVSNIRLTKFELVDTKQKFPPNDLRQFLLSQKETLKVLTIYQDEHDGLFEFVAFELEVEEFHTSVKIQDMIEEQKVNRSIKLLELRGIDTLLPYYRNLFHSLQAIETLHFFMVKLNLSIFAMFASSMPNFKSLIFNCDLDIDNLNILKEVRIKHVEYLETEPILEIFRLFPNVKKLELINKPTPASTLKEILQSEKHLEEITAMSLTFDDETVDLILQSNIRRITTSLEHSKEQPLLEKLKQSKIIFSKY